jgi:hypothetical protein
VYRTVIALVVVVTTSGAQPARAQPCPPAVALTGEPATVTAVRELLEARGILGETPSCPAVHARIERRGGGLVVAVDGPDGAIERAVGEPATAATVIESWARSDVAAPLLASRAVPVEAPVASPPAARGIQLFAAEEMSVASDRTLWQGMQLEACIMLGPVCAAARVHAARVIARPASWEGIVRKGAELYVGIDVPIAIGRTRLTPGFAAGYGAMFTRRSGGSEGMFLEIAGPRAEVHAAFSVPITDHLAVDLVTTGALTRATRIEAHGDVRDATVTFPAEPRALVRIALGLRYGAL